ncbi:MAG: hypothetical protein NVS3B10_23210 [Polyangiales bacterium]
MRRNAFLACVTLARAVPVFPAVARADDAATAEAQARFQEGLDLADAGKHEPARLKFQQAWSVFKSPAVLYNLARSEQLTGHELEALEHFRLFLRVGATDVKITDAMREKARQNVADLSRKVGQVEIEVPSTARVTVDGKPLDETPKDPVPLQPGRHTIEATFDGKVRNVSVECVAGSVVKARIDFDTTGSGPGEPPAEEPHGFWTTGRYVGLTAAIVGLGAIGTGVGFHFRASGKQDDANAKRATLPDQNSSCFVNPGLPQCAELTSLESDYKSASTLSTVFMVSGGALAIGGAILFIASSHKRSSEPSRGMRIIPMASSKEAGVSWMGTF